MIPGNAARFELDSTLNKQISNEQSFTALYRCLNFHPRATVTITI